MAAENTLHSTHAELRLVLPVELLEQLTAFGHRSGLSPNGYIGALCAVHVAEVLQGEGPRHG